MNKPNPCAARTVAMGVLTVFLLATACYNALAQDPVGRVVALRGKAMASRAGSSPRPLSLGSSVFLQDTILTGQARIQLMFMDNTLITLGKNTEMVIQAYVWKKGSRDSVMDTRVKAGSFRVMGGAITREAPENFTTQAPSATIGIRGSMYAGLVRGNSLTVVFQGGRGIFVANEQGRVDINIPGFSTIVKDLGRAPEKPVKADESLIQEIEGSMVPEDGLTQGEGEDGAVHTADAQGAVQENEASGPFDLSGRVTGPADGAQDSQPEVRTVAQAYSGSIQPDIVTETISDTALSDTDTGKAGGMDVIPPAADDSPGSADQSGSDPPDTSDTDPLDPTATDPLDPGIQDPTDPGTSAGMPDAGVWVYKGELTSNIGELVDDLVTAHVNWGNRRVLLFEEEKVPVHGSAHGFGFGQVNEDGTITNVQVMGSDFWEENGKVLALTGKETSGGISGTGYETMEVIVDGYDVNVQNQSDQTFWSDTLTAAKEIEQPGTDSGNETWHGFFTGIGEDMAQPVFERMAFMSQDPEDFGISVDRDAGTIQGIMKATDWFDSDNRVNLSLGGDESRSVYISNDRVAASLEGTVETASGNQGLKPYGNFMVSSMEAPLSDYTYWGYWEAAFERPGSGEDYHVHVPGVYWIAGKQTPASKVEEMIKDATAFEGVYKGNALGMKFNSTGTVMDPLANGQTQLTVKFDAAAVNPVSGFIQFDQKTLNVNSSVGDLFSTGFKGKIDSALNSRVNGAFFGPDAQAVGGNFSADMPDGFTYQGIFAGNR